MRLLSVQFTNADTGFATVLKNTVLVFNYINAIKHWYPYRPNFRVNSSVLIPDLQSEIDVRGSIQLIDNVLFPYNVSRLLPPSLVPIGRSDSPPGPGSSPPSPPGASLGIVLAWWPPLLTVFGPPTAPIFCRVPSGKLALPWVLR